MVSPQKGTSQMFIQTESTPNPATLKFLPGQAVLGAGTADFPNADGADASPLKRGALGGLVVGFALASWIIPPLGLVVSVLLSAWFVGIGLGALIRRRGLAEN